MLLIIYARVGLTQLYSILSFFAKCWETKLSIQARVEKINEDLHQPSGIRYVLRSFSVRCFNSLAYWEGIYLYGFSVCCGTPQPIGSFLCNRIGDSTGDVLCFSLGFGGTMCWIFLTCSLFLLVSVLHFIVCLSIDTPLYWFDPWPAFYHCLLCIHRFLAKSQVHTWIFWPKVMYTCRFLAKIHVYMQLFG